MRYEGSLIDIEKPLDVEETVDVEIGRKIGRGDKEVKVELQGITKKTTAAQILRRKKIKEERHGVIAVDVTEMGERIALTQARAKTEKHINAPPKWNIFKRGWRRQTAMGKEEQFRQQAAEEIFQRGHLAGNRENSYEIVDEVVESVEDASMRAAGENPELFTGAGGARLDALGAELLTAWVLGDIKTREEFDARFNQIILPEIGAASGKKIDGKLYGNSFFHTAEGYKKQFEEKLELTAEAFGPEQKKVVQTYLGRVFRMDVILAKQGADLYQMKPNSWALKKMESFVNWTQSPILNAGSKRIQEWMRDSKFGKSKTGQALNKLAAFFGPANPVFHAWVGSRLGYMAGSGLGVATVKGLGIGAAAAVGIGPAMAAAIGAAAGAGLYLGIRAAVEHWRGIRRRDEQEAIGNPMLDKNGRPMEEIAKLDARMAATSLRAITAKLVRGETLTVSEIDRAAKIVATLQQQDKLKRNLLKVGQEEGAAFDMNFVAVQDLRRAINDFRDINTKTPLPISIDLVIARMEREILDKIEGRQKELESNTFKRGAITGAISVPITFAASCLAPGVVQWLENHWNQALDFAGIGKLHFNTSGTTLTEELWHRAREKFNIGEHYGKYNGRFFETVSFGSAGNKHIIEFPQDQPDLGVSVNETNGHTGGYIDINSTHLGGETMRLNFGANGQIAQADLDMLQSKYGWDVEYITKNIPGVPGVPGAKGDVATWMNGVKGSGQHGINVVEAHTKGYYNNPFGDEEGNIFDTPNIKNELRLHINLLPNGDIKVDCNNLLQHGSWDMSANPPDMLALRASGDLKFVFIPPGGNAHEAIIVDMDSAGNAIIPLGSPVSELFDSAGNVRKGVVFGTAQVAPGAKGLGLTWVNSEKGRGAEMLFSEGGLGPAGGVASGAEQILGYRLRPPILHGDVGGILALAGARRETDADVMERRQGESEKAFAERKAREQAEWNERMAGVAPEERQRMALAEMRQGLAEGKTLDGLLLVVAPKYLLHTPEMQATLLNEALKYPPFSMTQEQIDKAVAVSAPTTALAKAQALMQIGLQKQRDIARNAVMLETTPEEMEMRKKTPEERSDLAWEALQPYIAKNMMDETIFNGIMERFQLIDLPAEGKRPAEDNKYRRMYLRKEILLALGIKAEEVDARLKKEREAFEALLASTPAVEADADATDDGDPAEDPAKSKDAKTPAPAKKPVVAKAAPETKPVFNEEKGLMKIVMEEMWNRRRAGERPKADRERLLEINRLDSNRGPHVEFSADSNLLIGPDVAFINSLAKDVHNFLVAEGLDPNVYSLNSYRVNITETPPHGWNADDKNLLSVSPLDSPNKIALDIITKTKGTETVKYRYRELSEVNNAKNNIEPILRFSYDPAVLIGVDQSAVNNYGQRLHTELRRQTKKLPRYKNALLRINFIKPGEPSTAVPQVDAHGYTIINLPFNDNVKRDVGIVFREMNRLAPEKLSSVNRQFIEDINKHPANQAPHVDYSILDDNLIRELKIPTSRSYLALVDRQVRAALNRKIAAANPVKQARIRGQHLKVNIVKDATSYRGFRDPGDRTYVLSFPPGATSQRIASMFETQFQDAETDFKPGSTSRGAPRP